MGTIVIEREMPASPAAVWAVLSDFGAIHRWNPNLRHSRLLEGSAVCGVGATRQCDLADGKGFIRERIIDWREGEAYTVDIYDGTMPLERAEATLGVRRDGDRTVASMTMRYVPKHGWLGTVMDWLVLRWMMMWMTRRVLVGLERTLRRAPQLPEAGSARA